MSRLTKLKKRYPWAKSVVICTEWLGKYRYPEELRGKYAKAFLLSRNTVPNHKIYKDRIRFESFLSESGIRWVGGEANSPVDTIPLREAAVCAGLGIMRKNNFFYGEKGSYYNLEGYLIGEECVLKQTCNLKPCSDKCNLCQNACRTKALCAPYTMSPISCLSLWTTFGKNLTPPHLKSDQFGEWMCGCDDCQDTCPHNRKHDWSEGEEFPGLHEIVELLQPENILKASKEELQKKVVPKTYDHVKPRQTNTFKRGAKRLIRLQEKAKN
ncbi:Epoxyqueuosine (oQ) reductase QueG [Lachnospiraceae bacterium TWA4]|nr:Epoxyqueuosine (oQ) reductase QueG [Lachnospiraceae bacterium TWA4]